MRAARLSHVALILALSCQPALAGPATTYQDYGRGAVAGFDTCAPAMNGNMLCQDFYVAYFIRSADNPKQGHVEFAHSAAIVHPDGSYDEFLVEFGFAEVTGTYDLSRLGFASMSGATIDLNEIDSVTGTIRPNGRTVTLGQFEWRAASNIYDFGNDGPFGLGLPRLSVDRCTTHVYNTHERFTTAYVTGTIDGVSVTQYGPSYLPWPGTGPSDALGAIFDNRLKYVAAPHC